MTKSQESKDTRLNVGCGGHILEGYVNIDQDSIEDIRARYPNQEFSDDLIVENHDVFDLPYADGTVSEIRADSFLEHLSFEEEPRFLIEAKRVLKVGGRLNLSVPDFEAVARLWLAAKDDWREFYRTDAEAIAQEHWFGTYSYATDNRWGYLTAIIYGNQNGEGQFHRNCYTEGKLRAMCKHLGLKVLEVDRFRWKGDRDPMLGLVAVKTNRAS